MLPIKDGDHGEIEAVNAKVQSGRTRRQSAPENIILYTESQHYDLRLRSYTLS